MEVTIYDVAKRAGVSLSTVSRVLNDSSHVRAATRERVLAAIETLGYKRNLLASALMTKQTRTIGLLVPDISNPFFAEICRSVEDACAQKGFSTVICNTDESSERQTRQVDLLRRKGVDGMIFASLLEGDENIFTLIDESYPFVLLSRGLEGHAANFVSVDDFAGGLMATRYLLELGHRRIAHLAGPLRSTPGLYRKKGYEAALEQTGVAVDSTLIYEGDFTIQSGMEMAEALLEAANPHPTAIFAGNDLIAIGALKVLRRRGIRVPEDLSIVGYDHTVLADVVDPALTSIEQPMATMGHIAVDLLCQQMNGERTGPRQVVLPPRLAVGHSTQTYQEQTPTYASQVAAARGEA